MIEKRLKVPNGKLLIVKAEFDGQTVKDARIQGDFFLYPEDKIGLIEEELRGSTIETVKDDLKKIVDKEKIKMVGLDIDSIVLLLKEIHDEMASATV